MEQNKLANGVLRLIGALVLIWIFSISLSIFSSLKLLSHIAGWL